MRVAVVVGARPQFIKAAPLMRALDAAGLESLLINTGQHYDDEMSAIFFSELGIAAGVDLEVGSMSRGDQLATMSRAIEGVLREEALDRVVVIGDTNSTLAGALAAEAVGLALAHIEAGLRSFDPRMPEEENRVRTDRRSDLLLCPSATAVANLKQEGITEGVHVVGDLMMDAMEDALGRPGPDPVQALGLDPGTFAVATIHRAENADDPSRLRAILTGLGDASIPVAFPVHPRTAEVLEREGLRTPDNVLTVPPLGHSDTVKLIRDARVVATDSGGIQKEAYWLETPCVTMRDSTEWVETVEAGWNLLVGDDAAMIATALRTPVRPSEHPSLYGPPGAAARCVQLVESSRLRKA